MPNANTGINRTYFTTDTNGVTRRLVLNGTVSVVDVDFRDIEFVGTTLTGSRIGDLGGNLGNIVFDAPKTVYLVGTVYTANVWSNTDGGWECDS